MNKKHWNNETNKQNAERKNGTESQWRLVWSKDERKCHKVELKKKKN